MFDFSDSNSDNRISNPSKTQENNIDAASRFLAMQRNIAGSDLIKHLQLGTIGSLDKEPQSGQSDNFAHGNNLPPLGLAGLAAAAGLAGLPLSSAGIPPLNSSVPTIAALLAASQEKLAADIRHNINGLEKDHDEHQGMQLPKDYFDIKDEANGRLNEFKELKHNFSNSNNNDVNEDLTSDVSKTFQIASSQVSRAFSSQQENQQIKSCSANASKRKYRSILLHLVKKLFNSSLPVLISMEDILAYL